MKVIDANTGLELHEGMRFRNMLGEIHIQKINPGISIATIEVIINGKYSEIPLVVRWFHPRFLFRHVAFFPS